jgi:CheY-like chemotaxis protein/HPt (histidine-containing phosphotransfer) domain-containing protein
LIGDENQLMRNIVPPLHIPREIKNLKVLIVDDEEYNRLLFKTILNRWEIEFREAMNGIEALEMLKADHYDLLFMDVRMPGLDGIKTTQFIREVLKIKGSEMPVICISAASVNDDLQKYQEAGMNAFLQKPFTEEMLLSAILSVTGVDKKINNSGTGSKENYKLPGSDKINLGNLYRITDGDEQFIKKMLVSYIDTMNRGLNEMQEFVTSGQLESVASLSHKLLPPSRHIGALDLCNLLQKIEEGAQNNIDTQIIDTLTRESIREFGAVCELLQDRIAKIS